MILVVGWLLLICTGVAATFSGMEGWTGERLLRLLTVGEMDPYLYRIIDIRLPRMLLALLIGAAHAVGGCLLQVITRNPLADLGIMGVNQGASFFVVGGLLLLGEEEATLTVMLFAFLGAAVGGGCLYRLAVHNRYTPMRLVLAGVAIAFFFGSLTTGVILLHESSLLEILYWMAGKLSGATWGDIWIGSSLFLPTLACSWLLAPSLNLSLLDEQIAQGLGQNVVRTRRWAALFMMLLAGGSVALAGPIGFVGLIVPHIARALLGERGQDYRFVLPIATLLGADLLLIADVCGQWVMYPTEMPVGVITVLLGTPFFLYFIRSKQGGLC
jgi:ferric citrate transport system permease protein